MDSFDYSDEFLAQIADFFKAFSHVTRLKILRALYRRRAREGAEGRGLNVGELQEAVGTSQANVSKHLKQMKEQGILEVRVDGNERTYVVADDEVTKICDYVCEYTEDRLRKLSDIGGTIS